VTSNHATHTADTVDIVYYDSRAAVW